MNIGDKLRALTAALECWDCYCDDTCKPGTCVACEARILVPDPEAVGFMVSLACEIVGAGEASPTAKRHLAKLEGALKVTAEQRDRISHKRHLEIEQTGKDLKRIAELKEALETIAFTGTDCHPADHQESFYRAQLQACIATAARALAKLKEPDHEA